MGLRKQQEGNSPKLFRYIGESRCLLYTVIASAPERGSGDDSIISMKSEMWDCCVLLTAFLLFCYKIL